jgi:F0F1-type ATP synthase membrane subunit b/b'
VSVVRNLVRSNIDELKKLEEQAEKLAADYEKAREDLKMEEENLKPLRAEVNRLHCRYYNTITLLRIAVEDRS